jgi:CubicO group peptidase (beta-lactamase class C family)
VRIGGTVAAGYEGVRAAFEADQAGDPGSAQLSVYRDGAPIVDLWAAADDRPGFDGDALVVLRSTTKGALAACMAILVDRGLLDVAAPVARYWPEFAARGKEHVTTAHLLTHTAGLPGFPPSSGIHAAADLADWDRCVEALADAELLWRPGATQGTYHSFTIGYLAGEVLRRITGRTVGRFFADDVAGPLGLDFWLGLPAEQEARVVPYGVADPTAPTTPVNAAQWAAAGWDVDDPAIAAIIASFEAFPDAGDLLNSREGHAIQFPSGNGIANARSVARMYAALVGPVDGVRLVSPETLDFVRTNRTRHLPPLPGMPTPELGPDQGWGLGFALSEPMRGCFGHAGAGGVQGFGHPELGIAAAYVCTTMMGPEAPRTTWIAALEEAMSR